MLWFERFYLLCQKGVSVLVVFIVMSYFIEGFDLSYVFIAYWCFDHFTLKHQVSLCLCITWLLCTVPHSILATFDDLELKGLVPFGLFVCQSIWMSKNIALDPWRIKLFLDQLDYIFHLVSNPCLFFPKPIKLGLLLSYFLSSLIQVDFPRIWILLKNIQHCNQNVSS